MTAFPLMILAEREFIEAQLDRVFCQQPSTWLRRRCAQARRLKRCDC
jgi:hypothetical protein